MAELHEIAGLPREARFFRADLHVHSLVLDSLSGQVKNNARQLPLTLMKNQ